MTRSAYATPSSLAVPCNDKFSMGCGAKIGEPCVSYETGKPRKKAHSARRKAADDKRTLEVHGITPEILEIVQKPTERFLARHPEWRKP